MTEIEIEKLKIGIELNSLKKLQQYQEDILTNIVISVKICEKKLKEFKDDPT